MTDMLDIELSKITIPEDRARELDVDWAAGLAAIIKSQGLTNPITVRKVDDKLRLVTGLHRIEALRINGETHIPAKFSIATTDEEARLEEVMENLARHELNALDRSHHLYELKKVYETLHPETKAGVAGALAKHGAASEMFSFAENTAEKLGLSRRIIEIAVKIWTELTPASRARLPGTSLAKKQSELKLLSAQPAPIQKKILDLVFGDDHPISSVQEALDYLDNGVAHNTSEKKFEIFVKTFAALEDVQLDRVLIAQEERVIASLKRRGRI